MLFMPNETEYNQLLRQELIFYILWTVRICVGLNHSLNKEQIVSIRAEQFLMVY